MGGFDYCCGQRGPWSRNGWEPLHYKGKSSQDIISKRSHLVCLQ